MSSSETRISTVGEVVGEQPAAEQPAAQPAAGEFRLGRLQRLDAGEVWSGGDLTPWLRSSPEQLGEALRLEIRPSEDQEPPETIGELTAGVPVVVKSRFAELTDADVRELAALVADLDAGVLVLLGPALPVEARERLSKLHRNTSRAIVFYGIEFELWRIDDSAPAPVFRVVAGPEGWDRQPPSSTKGTDEELAQALAQNTAGGSGDVTSAGT
jgi:hypothetical protein